MDTGTRAGPLGQAAAVDSSVHFHSVSVYLCLFTSASEHLYVRENKVGTPQAKA